MYVFRINLIKAHSLEQNYHPTQPFKQEKYNTKYNTKYNPKIKNISVKIIYNKFI
jgi:hypothetical protein